MQDLDPDPVAAPADDRPLVELVHDGRVVLVDHLGSCFVSCYPDRLAAVLLEEFAFRELGGIDLLREGIHAAVHLVPDACFLDCFLCRYLAIPIDFDERDRFDLPVLSCLLEVAKGDVVERCMGGDTHDETACHVRVDEVCREDRDLAAERVADLLVDQVFSGDLFLNLDGVVLQGKLLGCLSGNDPGFAVHESFYVRNDRVGP